MTCTRIISPPFFGISPSLVAGFVNKGELLLIVFCFGIRPHLHSIFISWPLLAFGRGKNPLCPPFSGHATETSALKDLTRAGTREAEDTLASIVDRDDTLKSNIRRTIDGKRSGPEWTGRTRREDRKESKVKPISSGSSSAFRLLSFLANLLARRLLRAPPFASVACARVREETSVPKQLLARIPRILQAKKRKKTRLKTATTATGYCARVDEDMATSVHESQSERAASY